MIGIKVYKTTKVLISQVAGEDNIELYVGIDIFVKYFIDAIYLKIYIVEY